MNKFIKIILTVAFTYWWLSTPTVFADCKSDMMPMFTAAQANAVCGSFSAGDIGTLANDTFAVGRNAADDANINVWKIDTSDNTVLNSSASDDLILQLEDDANRLIGFDAASDTAIRMYFGDGGTTSSQSLVIGASTADADDDSVLSLNGGGGAAADSTRGAYIQVSGLDVGGASAGGNADIVLGGTAANFHVTGNGAATHLIDLEDSNDTLTFASSVSIINTGYTITPAATPVAGTNDIRQFSIYPTAANGAAALLPTPAAVGLRYIMYNSGPNTVRIKPGGTNTLNGGAAGAYLALATLNTAECVTTSATSWNCDIKAIPTPQGP